MCACFRPLSGSYISQSSTHHSAILHYRFPSPIGELHFSIVRNAYWTKKTISVSVPYRGATFLNDVRLRGYDKRTEVSVPYRGATFLNPFLRNTVRPQEINVSVPYRGATFLNNFGDSVKWIKKVSVPYRGATFLNIPKDQRSQRAPLFPSPIGELHFSIGDVLSIKKYFLCFRPLSGSYISQCFSHHFHLFNLSYVSVPYRGATFLNQFRYIHS